MKYILGYSWIFICILLTIILYIIALVFGNILLVIWNLNTKHCNLPHVWIGHDNQSFWLEMKKVSSFKEFYKLKRPYSQKFMHEGLVH